MTHGELSSALLRPPGTPAATCPGRLYRVNGSGGSIARDAMPTPDAALPGEGDWGDVSEIRLWRCRECDQTLVEATGPDGRKHLRNSWNKSQPLEV